MKICWDTLEGLKYIKKSGVFRNYTNSSKYIYADECPTCHSPFLAQIYYRNGEKQFTTSCCNKCASKKRPTPSPKPKCLPGEVWELIPNASGYSVSNRGRVSGKQVPLLRPGTDRQGYKNVILYHGGRNDRTMVLVASLVAEAFHGPRPMGREVHHKNGIKADNRAENLEYVTPAENIQASSSITREDIIEIRREFDRGRKRADIAIANHISLANVYIIGRRETWKNI